jgi:hypothetical protein
VAETPKDHLSKLTEMLGFDPGKKDQITADMFKEVTAEIQAEKNKLLREKAKVQLIRAIEMREQKEKTDREYSAASKKWDKEMGKILSGIESMLTGKPVQEEDPVKAD